MRQREKVSMEVRQGAEHQFVGGQIVKGFRLKELAETIFLFPQLVALFCKLAFLFKERGAADGPLMSLLPKKAAQRIGKNLLMDDQNPAV